MAVKKNPLDVLRGAVEHFRHSREEAKEIAKSVKQQQPELISAMEDAEVGEVGLIIDPNDSRGTAYVQQNEGSTVWNEEKVLDYIKKHKLWVKCSSRVLDMNKFEALVASKEIPAKSAKRMQKKLGDPEPFIRFGPKGDDSV